MNAVDPSAVHLAYLFGAVGVVALLVYAVLKARFDKSVASKQGEFLQSFLKSGVEGLAQRVEEEARDSSSKLKEPSLWLLSAGIVLSVVAVGLFIWGIGGV